MESTVEIPPAGPISPLSPVRENFSTSASLFENGLAAEDPTFATVIFLYPDGDASAETLNSSHFVASPVACSRMCPLMVDVESSNVFSTSVHTEASEPERSARIVVVAFCVALSSRKIPAPGSESVVVVLKVYGIVIAPPAATEFSPAARAFACVASVLTDVLNAGSAVPSNISPLSSNVDGSAVVGTLPRLGMISVIVAITLPQFRFVALPAQAGRCLFATVYKCRELLTGRNRHQRYRQCQTRKPPRHSNLCALVSREQACFSRM